MTKEINFDYGNTTNPTNDHEHKILFTDHSTNTDYCINITNCNHSDLSNIDYYQVLDAYKVQQNLSGETSN